MEKKKPWPPKESVEKFDREIGAELGEKKQKTLFVTMGYGDEVKRNDRKTNSSGSKEIVGKCH